jgi:hypothetical protein
MEHAIHIACKHFVETVVSTSGVGDEAKGEESSSDDEFTPGDALGKALALVKQVSPRTIIYSYSGSLTAGSGSQIASSKDVLQVIVRPSWHPAT